jgi:hypothetical protein
MPLVAFSCDASLGGLARAPVAPSRPKPLAKKLSAASFVVHEFTSPPDSGLELTLESRHMGALQVPFRRRPPKTRRSLENVVRIAIRRVRVAGPFHRSGTHSCPVPGRLCHPPPRCVFVGITRWPRKTNMRLVLSGLRRILLHSGKEDEHGYKNVCGALKSC